MVDLQGFPTTSQHQMLQNAYNGLPWGTYLQECFLKGGGKQALTRPETIELTCDHANKEEHERCLE
jgi:hypothetical protein